VNLSPWYILPLRRVLGWVTGRIEVVGCRILSEELYSLACISLSQDKTFSTAYISVQKSAKLYFRICLGRDQLIGLEGSAGAGKTTALAAIREVTEGEGYLVEGLAPTSRAAQQLGGVGISSSTLQHHLARSNLNRCGQKHLYIVDESSLASTRQVNEFLHQLQEGDRVIFVGDSRQHQGVEAGRPFQQLQDAGLRTAHLDEIVRQKDPALKQVVQHLALGKSGRPLRISNSRGGCTRSRIRRSGCRLWRRSTPSMLGRPW